MRWRCRASPGVPVRLRPSRPSRRRRGSKESSSRLRPAGAAQWAGRARPAPRSRWRAAAWATSSGIARSRIDVGAVDLAVDREDVTHDVVVLFAERLQGLHIVRLGALEAAVLQRELQAGARARRRDRRAEIARELALDLADGFPNLLLALAYARALGSGRRGRGRPGQVELGRARRQRGIRAREFVHRLAAACRPAALLDAERGDGKRSRMRLEQQADGEHAVLLPALHDVAGLDEDFLVAVIVDRELVDPADLAYVDVTAPLQASPCVKYIARLPCTTGPDEL